MKHDQITSEIKSTAAALRDLKARQRVLKRLLKASNALERQKARLSFLDCPPVKDTPWDVKI